MNDRRFLVVCCGNTCRSPMAGEIIRHVAERAGQKVEVRTAGLWPQEHNPLATNAVTAMREIGLDISDDYPKGLTPALIEWADVIVPVEEHYGDEIVDRFQEASEKVRTLTSSIPDPYCKDLRTYRECRDLLLQAARRLVEEPHPG